MALLDYFKSRKRLRREYDKACTKLSRINDILKRQEKVKFLVWENPQDFVVTKQISYRDKSGSVDIVIKRFPKLDDADYACLCANELLTELTKEI